MSRFLSFLAAALLAAPMVFAGADGLGRLALPDEIAAWDIDVRPDGQGLPAGRGTVAEGEVIFTAKCAVCHGDFGEAIGRWPELAGGFDTLATDDPVKTTGSFWPYVSTIWDYIHRAMPYGQPQSLGDDETYALVAYILFLNDVVVDEEFELSRENFTEISLPNEGGFYPDNRDEVELPLFVVEPCMVACKDVAEITARASDLDVTPSDDGGPAADDLVSAATEVLVPDAELVAAGRKLFRRCKACHQVGEGAKNRTGPQLNGLIGRNAASVEGFRYSKAFAQAGDAGLVWTPDTLAEFLRKPKAFIPKNRMSFGGFKKPGDTAAIIAYLQSASEL